MIEKIKSLPNSFGIYQYFNKDGNLLYIGKAKSLKNRVRSYFRFTPNLAPASNLSARIFKMVSEISNLEYIVVESEIDALILENSLIKQLKPKYNILLRDDKTYPYIFIDMSVDFPRFEITRKIVTGRGIKYFGPFSGASREILESLYELFLLVQKKNCLNGKKACLFYQINRCLAPCEKKIDKDKYRLIINNAINCLKNRNLLLKKLNEKMLQESKKLLFEEATKTRDRIIKIKNSFDGSNIDLLSQENLDIFAVAVLKTKAIGIRIFVREGRVISSSHSWFKSDEILIDEIYKRLIIEYYLSNPLIIPKSVLIYEKFSAINEIEELLANKFAKKVLIIKPIRGKKRSLVEVAYRNAMEILKIKKDENEKVLGELKELLKLSTTPYNIEIFDNSHHSGEAIVGAMVKWDGEFLKGFYRHYHLKSRDEYSQMRETLSRRISSFNKNPPPDLWVIDGGETLCKLAVSLLEKEKIAIDVIGISKERDFKTTKRSKIKANDKIYSKSTKFKLLNSDKRLQFVQKLRDEAHRFAITFHRKIKLKKDKEIKLLKLNGIGEAKVKRLIDVFGSFEAINTASLDELEMIVDKKDAEIIFLKS